jgi:large subunit ribosomal protein L10
MTNQKKLSQLQILTAALKAHTNFLLISFDKTTHKNLEKLRQELRPSQTTIKVIKNTLFEKTINKMAVENKNLLDFKKKFLPLKDTTALIAFNGDWSTGLNVLAAFMKKEKTLSFKAATLDNENYDQAMTKRIAELPGRDQLAAQIIGSLKNPSQRFVGALSFNITKFVYILNQKAKQV